MPLIVYAATIILLRRCCCCHYYYCLFIIMPRAAMMPSALMLLICHSLFLPPPCRCFYGGVAPGHAAPPPMHFYDIIIYAIFHAQLSIITRCHYFQDYFITPSLFDVAIIIRQKDGAAPRVIDTIIIIYATYACILHQPLFAQRKAPRSSIIPRQASRMAYAPPVGVFCLYRNF